MNETLRKKISEVREQVEANRERSKRNLGLQIAMIGAWALATLGMAGSFSGAQIVIASTTGEAQASLTIPFTL